MYCNCNIVLILLTVALALTPVSSQIVPYNQVHQDGGSESTIPKEIIPIVCLFSAGFILIVCILSVSVFCLSDFYCSSPLDEEDDDVESSYMSSSESTALTPKLKLLEDGEKDNPPPDSHGSSADSNPTIAQDLPKRVIHDDSFSVIINMEPHDSKLKEMTRFLLQSDVTQDHLRTIDRGLTSLGSAGKQMGSLLPSHLEDIQRLRGERHLCSSKLATVRG